MENRRGSRADGTSPVGKVEGVGKKKKGAEEGPWTVCPSSNYRWLFKIKGIIRGKPKGGSPVRGKHFLGYRTPRCDLGSRCRAKKASSPSNLAHVLAIKGFKGKDNGVWRADRCRSTCDEKGTGNSR